MEDKVFYNCVFSSKKENDYITFIYNSKVKVYNGYHLIFELEIENINGAVFFNNTLYYTCFNDCCIYLYKEDSCKSKIIIDKYNEIKILKYINNTLNWFALKIDNKKFIAYDIEQGMELFSLPLQHKFTDLAIVDNKYGIMIGCEIKDVSVYEGDGDEEYIILCIFTYDVVTKKNCILDTFSLFFDGSFEYEQQEIPGKSMKIPKYTGKNTSEKSISSNGKYFVYYSDVSKRVVISKVENGVIFRLFVFPIDISKNGYIYFNDITNVITIVNDENVEQFYINQSDELINKLNYESEKFSNITNEVYKTMYSTQFINLKEKYDFDVALSFAGEDREYVERIASNLKSRGIKVFYDKFEVANLWGKDLYQYLSHIYKDNARFCIVFVSQKYKEKAWTKHELKNAQNRAFHENKEYILPVFLENIELDGLNDTIGYIKVSEFSESEIVDLIIEKVNKI